MSRTIVSMCGIAGVVAWDERYRIKHQTLECMGEAIAHRGPDGRDLWMDDKCGLAFARLAILDLDQRAMQPITDGKRRLVFNGEIYNFRELRAELEKVAPGYAWKTTGDSEVILRAFDAWGETCVQRFNGMFALAIWEPQTESLFLAGSDGAKAVVCGGPARPRVGVRQRTWGIAERPVD